MVYVFLGSLWYAYHLTPIATDTRGDAQIYIPAHMMKPAMEIPFHLLHDWPMSCQRTQFWSIKIREGTSA
jgi:hypothetical protein